MPSNFEVNPSLGCAVAISKQYKWKKVDQVSFRQQKLLNLRTGNRTLMTASLEISRHELKRTEETLSNSNLEPAPSLLRPPLLPQT